LKEASGVGKSPESQSRNRSTHQAGGRREEPENHWTSSFLEKARGAIDDLKAVYKSWGAGQAQTLVLITTGSKRVSGDDEELNSQAKAEDAFFKGEPVARGTCSIPWGLYLRSPIAEGRESPLSELYFFTAAVFPSTTSMRESRRAASTLE